MRRLAHLTGWLAFYWLLSPHFAERGPVESLTIVEFDESKLAAIENGAKAGEAIAAGVNRARDLVNEPPNYLLPSQLAEAAVKMAEETGVKCVVHDIDWMREQKMGALLGVTQGSANPPQFVELEYQGSDAAPIIFVGKGITFDSGGISIKAADGMEAMKNDMGGAAAVIGAVEAVARLKLPLHVLGLIPTCETLPSGTAYRPADLLTSRNGKTSRDHQHRRGGPLREHGAVQDNGVGLGLDARHTKRGQGQELEIRFVHGSSGSLRFRANKSAGQACLPTKIVWIPYRKIKNRIGRRHTDLRTRRLTPTLDTDQGRKWPAAAPPAPRQRPGEQELAAVVREQPCARQRAGAHRPDERREPLPLERLQGRLPFRRAVVPAQSVQHQQVVARRGLELPGLESVRTRVGAVEHRVARVDLGVFGGSALTDRAIAVPTASTAGIPVTYVPARNTVLLALALAHAEVVGADAIFTGANAVDYSGYPDCRPEYLAAFAAMANLATKRAVDGSPIVVRSPIVQLSKAGIVRRGHELGVDFAVTLSCYDADGQGRACGRCDSCRLRPEGFAARPP